ncbi:MAG TPA: endonuclease/exonuclease/phosphatase family protein [Acidimicrobiales bacterium]|nr:endonuclease/exonuclease/phosphatase family protein [Acidimicrobiales bacterium]
MRIVTFNIQHARRPDGTVDIDALGAACAGFGANLLALQEVDVHLERSGRRDMAADVAVATGMEVAFGPAIAIRGGQYGNALLVRGPLADVAVAPLSLTARAEARSVLLASALGCSVAATHLSIDDGEAQIQLAEVVRLLRDRPPPYVLLGDLNLRTDQLSDLDLALADGADPTWPAGQPRVRIDHVAVEGLSVERVSVLPAAPVSDHRPLLVEAGITGSLVGT